jgi:septal ring factor EnvC (AmiA/AmiB activator)
VPGYQRTLRRRFSRRFLDTSEEAAAAVNFTTAKKAVMAERDGHAAALRALAAMEQNAIARARAAGEQARAEAAARTGRAATEQPAVVSIPTLGPYKPPTPGEQAAAAAGAQMLARLEALEAERWRLSVPVVGDDR